MDMRWYSMLLMELVPSPYYNIRPNKERACQSFCNLGDPKLVNQNLIAMKRISLQNIIL